MNSECDVCGLVKKGKIVYENDKVVAVLAPKPAVAGHIVVIPKEHFQIFEQVPDFVISEMFVVANKLLMACFEALGADGTNILIQNGVAAGQTQPHFMIHILPRKQNDNLKLAWQPKELSEEEMSTVELKLKEETKDVGIFEKEPAKPVEEKPPEQIEVSDEENYLIKQLERIP